MNLVLGTGAVILFYSTLTDSWVPYGCARTGAIDVTTDFIEVTGLRSGKFRDFLPTVNSFTGTLEGLHNLNTPGLVSIADLQTKELTHQVLLIRFDYTSEQGDHYVLEGNFYISSSRINNSFDNVSTFSVDLKGTGELTQQYTATPIIRGIVIREQFIILQGADDVTIPAIDGVDPANILLVTAGGYDYEDMILTGTPVNLVGGSQFLFQSSGGKLVFPSGVAPVDTNGVVLYQTIISGS